MGDADGKGNLRKTMGIDAANHHRGDKSRSATSTDERDKRKRGRSREEHRDKTDKNHTDDESHKQPKKFLGRCRLFVGNLPTSLKDSELKELFTRYGEVSECFCSPDKGFGFVRMDTRSHAEAAKEALDGFELRGRAIRVRFAVHVAAIKVKEISPFISNELLQQAFSMFGEVERAVHYADEKGRPVGEGIVEFSRRPGAQDAIKRISDGVFMLSANPKPVVVEAIEGRDEEDGVVDRLIPKSSLCLREREMPPRFAAPGSFEYSFGQRWKALYNEEKMRKDQLEDEFRDRRRHLENEMDLAHQEYQTSLIREDLKRRQEELERLERETKEKVEMARRFEDERTARIMMNQGSVGYQKHYMDFPPAFANTESNFFPQDETFASHNKKYKMFGDQAAGNLMQTGPFPTENYRLLQPSSLPSGADYYAGPTVNGFDSNRRSDANLYGRADFPHYGELNGSSRRGGRDDQSGKRRRR